MGQVKPKNWDLVDGGSLIVRTAEQRDAGRLLELSRQVMAEGLYMITEADEHTFTVAQAQQWVSEQVDNPSALCVVAQINGQVIGSLDFACEKKRRTSHTGVLAMYVADGWREKGVGSALLATLVEWAGQNPAIEKVCLTVFASNLRAMTLYRKFGFHEEGRRVRQIRTAPDQYEDLIEMSRFLHEGRGTRVP